MIIEQHLQVTQSAHHFYAARCSEGVTCKSLDNAVWVQVNMLTFSVNSSFDYILSEFPNIPVALMVSQEHYPFIHQLLVWEIFLNLCA